MSEPGSRTMVWVWRAALLLLAAVAGCGGWGQSHALPDAALADASVACQWQLGEGRRLPHSSRGVGLPPPGFGPADSGTWIVSREDGDAWLHHLDVNGDDLAAPSLVGSDYGLGSVDILLGRTGRGLVMYDGCPPEGEQCMFGGGGEYERRRVPQLRAFDADGMLGPVQYLDAPGSINEPLF
ncbi:MAG: hypothetical protein GXP55_18715, partial [Deltaproteobacteria bacterium]|nr:hypothetical protein [Deltaproteobacteria bacterium]